MANSTFIERPRSYCAQGGAVLTATAIPGVVPILHSSMGCGASIYYTQMGASGHLGAGYCGGVAIPSSNVSEKDIVFGGDERLREQVENTVKLVDGQLYVILTGCMTDIIGDDIQSVVRDFSERGVPIVGIETGGFKGDGHKGYDLLLTGLFKRFVVKNETKDPLKVNLFGIIPGQDPFWRGNLINLKALLSKLGLKVNTFVTSGETLDNLREAGSASLNIVVSQYYGIESAKVFEQVHGVPFVSGQTPIGPTATTEFLCAIADRLTIDPAVVERVIAEEEADYYAYADRLADTYNDSELQRYAVVVGDANYAPSITRFLADDFGWLPELTQVTDDLYPEQHAPIEAYLANLAGEYRTHLVFETDGSQAAVHLARIWPRNRGSRYYDSFSPAFVIGSHIEREFANSIGAAHLSVNYPIANRVVLSRGYTGYAGALTLIEDLLAVLVAGK